MRVGSHNPIFIKVCIKMEFKVTKEAGFRDHGSAVRVALLRFRFRSERRSFVAPKLYSGKGIMVSREAFALPFRF